MLHGRATAGMGVVLACSALKQSYREILGRDLTLTWIYLKATPGAIRERIEHRHGHFAKEDLLQSQFDALEEPADALVVNADGTPEEILRDILERIGKSATAQ